MVSSVVDNDTLETVMMVRINTFDCFFSPVNMQSALVRLEPLGNSVKTIQSNVFRLDMGRKMVHLVKCLYTSLRP